MKQKQGHGNGLRFRDYDIRYTVQGLSKQVGGFQLSAGSLKKLAVVSLELIVISYQLSVFSLGFGVSTALRLPGYALFIDFIRSTIQDSVLV